MAMQEGQNVLADPNGAPLEKVGSEANGTAPTPEEQQAYDEIMRTALGIIYPGGDQAGQVSPQIMQNLQGQFDPQIMQMFALFEPPIAQNQLENLSVTAVMLTIMVEMTLEQGGEQLPDAAVMHAGKDILEELVEVTEASGAGEVEQADMEAALLRAFDIYRQSAPRVDNEALTAEFGQILDADKSGDLDAVLPGAAEYVGAEKA